MTYRALLATAVGAVAIAIAGCGGGGTTPPPPALGPTPTPAPITVTTPIPAPAVSVPPAFTVQSTQAVPTAAPAASSIAIALPVDRTTGSTASISLPISAGRAVPANTSIDETLQSALDASDPVFLSAGRGALAMRDSKDGTAAGRITLSLMKISFNVDLSLSSGLGLTYRVPGTYPTSGVSYYVAYYDPTTPLLGWQQGYESAPVITPVTLSNGAAGTQFAFTGNPNPITFAAYRTYRFLLYAVSSSAASPTPEPVGVPTNPPVPTPAPVIAAPATLAFATATSPVQTVSVTQSGYTGAFTLRGLDSCATIAKPTISGSTVSVAPLALGACSFYVVGDRAYIAIAVTVSNPTGITIVIPGATPTPSATASPAPGPVVSPSSVNVVVGAQVAVSATKASYTGAYFASLQDPSVAVINPTVWTLPGPAQFIVTGRVPGTTLMIVSDAAGLLTLLPVTVTIGAPALVAAGSPNPPIVTSPTSPATLSRSSPANVRMLYPSYPGSMSVANPPAVTPSGCVTVTATTSNPNYQEYTVVAVSGAPASCTATITLSETTAGTTGTVTGYVILP